MRLQLTATGWLLFASAATIWALSGLAVILRARHAGRGWRVIPLSLFGFCWLAFGAMFVARFTALLWDPVLFRATAFPLWLVPGDALAHAWLCLGVYWCCFCLGTACALAATPRRLPRALGRLDRLSAPGNVAALDLLAAGSAAAVLSSSLLTLPAGLATPMGHLRALWVIPATLAWHRQFAGERPGVRRFLYMLPGVMMFALSPYREHLLLLFLCVALPLIHLRQKVGLLRVGLCTAAALVISSVVIYVYRPVIWDNRDWSSSVRYADTRLWRQRPEQAPWTRLSMRLHGFDSAALTVWLVPDTFARVERHIPAELAVSAFLPRAIYGGKARTERGRLFSSSVWAYDENGTCRSENSAMIAPSMPGDLWSAGGLAAIALGALAWGALIGMLECWRRALQPAAASALVAFLAFRVAGGMERDFVLATATIVQVLIILVGVLCLLPLGTHDATPVEGRPRRRPLRPDPLLGDSR